MIDRMLEDRATPASSEETDLTNEMLEARCWGYDIRRLDTASGHRPLSCITYFALSRLGCLQRLGLDDRKLRNFLTAVEVSMPDGNPYHNRVHVAGVVQQMFAQLSSIRLDDPLVNCACVIAAAIHDCNHPGLSVDKWRAVDPRCLPPGISLEEYHLDCARRIMTHPANDFLEAVDSETSSRLQGLVSELVLATDMSQHSRIMDAVAPSPEVSQSEKCPVWLLRLLIKVADLHHCVGSTASHVHWAQNLQSEMRCQKGGADMQGDFERGQLQFFDNVVLPMVDRLEEACPVAAPVGRLARANRGCWACEVSQ